VEEPALVTGRVGCGRHTACVPYRSIGEALKGLRMLAVERSIGRFGVRRPVGSDVLIQTGLDALLAGVDSPSLRMLAGLGRSEGPEASELFDAAIDELSLDTDLPSDPRDARWALVEWWAQLVVDGELAPHEGGHLIWHDGWTELDAPTALQPIVGWTSEWDDWGEDWEKPREDYARRIAEACRDFLAPAFQ